MRNRSRLLLIFLSLCAAGILSAQEFRGQITGRVLDPSGSAVPANVIVRNLDTNIENAVKADANGEFSILFLRPGNYSLLAQAPGFKKYSQNKIILEVSQNASFTIKLEIGSQTQSIEVTAATQQLDLESASKSFDINSQQVSELPLNYRNPYSLIQLMPGVEFQGNQSWIRPFDGSTNTAFSMNGGAVGVNEILIDGASNTAMGGSGTGTGVAYVPTIDSVTEIKVATTAFDASVGRTAGGVSSLATKTGTNAIHGTAYEFYKRQWLDANTFHNKSQGVLIPRQSHFLDQYGGELDGPVYIPKIYNGKNKTFFTFSYEKYREGSPINIISSFPAPEFLTGDFSKLADNTGKKITIYDPMTGYKDPTNTIGLGWSRLPFANNAIPQSRISSVALAIAKYYPAPNGCVTPNSAYSSNNFCIGSIDQDHYDNLLIKIDHNISAKNHIFFRYGGYNRDENRLTNGIVGPGESGQQPFGRWSNSAIADWVSTINPTLIFNIHGSYTRFIEGSYGRDNRGFDLTSLGFPAALVNSLPVLRDFGVYSPGLTGLGRGTTLNYDNNYEIAGNLTKIWKTHSIRAGMDVREYNYLLQSTGNIFTFSGNTNMTAQNYNGAAGATLSGYQFASWMMGAVTGSINLPVYPWFKEHYLSPFIQDDWKVNRRLTLNLGLRWDANLPGRESFNRISIGFDPNAASPIQGVNTALLQNGQTSLKGGLLFAGVNGAPDTAYDAYLKTLQFRIGGAYKLTDKIVVRGGYGVYYAPLGNGYQGNRPGFTQSTSYTSSLDNNQTPQLNFANPFPATSALPLGYQPAVGAANGLLTNVGGSVSTYNRAAQLPRTDQISFGFQFAVSKTSVLDVSYGGSRGKNLEQNGIGLNLPTLAQRQQCNPWDGKGGIGSYCDALLPNPFLNNPTLNSIGAPAFAGTSYYTSATVSRYNLERPFPQFTNDLTPGGVSVGKSWYNSAQVSYKFRVNNGLNLITNYTFSKWIQTTGYLDPFVAQEGRAINGNDETHIVKVIAVYQLPFGKGKHFLRTSNRLVDGVLGGWEVNSSYIVHSGQPINFPTNALMLNNVFNNNPDWKAQQPNFWSRNYCVYQVNADNSLTKTTNTVQANCPQTTNANGQNVPDFSKYDWVIKPGYAPSVNSSANGQHRLPRVTTMDASLSKTVHITERLQGQIRFEAFNVLNHFVITQANIDTNPSSTTFGTITPSNLGSGSGFPRTIQLGAKLVW